MDNNITVKQDNYILYLSFVFFKRKKRCFIRIAKK